jgi:hypothetical protein
MAILIQVQQTNLTQLVLRIVYFENGIDRIVVLCNLLSWL